MSSVPFKMTISPIKEPADVGSAHQVTVYNDGQAPLTIQTSAHEILRNPAGHCVVANRPASWASVSPANFTLKPGTHKDTVLTIRPGATPGQHDIAAWATTIPGHQAATGNSLHVGASLGSQFLVRVPGKVTTSTAPCVSLAPPAGHGAPLGAIIVSVAGVLLVLLAVWAILLRRSARRRTS